MTAEQIYKLVCLTNDAVATGRITQAEWKDLAAVLIAEADRRGVRTEVHTLSLKNYEARANG
jgi:hypothetical protein